MTIEPNRTNQRIIHNPQVTRTADHTTFFVVELGATGLFFATRGAALAFAADLTERVTGTPEETV